MRSISKIMIPVLLSAMFSLSCVNLVKAMEEEQEKQQRSLCMRAFRGVVNKIKSVNISTWFLVSVIFAMLLFPGKKNSVETVCPNEDEQFSNFFFTIFPDLDQDFLCANLKAFFSQVFPRLMKTLPGSWKAQAKDCASYAKIKELLEQYRLMIDRICPCTSSEQNAELKTSLFLANRQIGFHPCASFEMMK